jgi:hypothetical protein
MRATRKSEATVMTSKRPNPSSEHAASDEAAAYIAQMLMDLALQFEANHFAQIRRHYQSITPRRDDDPRQLNLFGRHPPF